MLPRGAGHLAVQLAKIAGAEVFVTASERHHHFLTTLGVDQIIDYTKVSFNQVVDQLNLVIDLVGGQNGVDSLSLLSPGGRIVTVPAISRDHILQQVKIKNVMATGMLAEIWTLDKWKVKIHLKRLT